MRNTGNDAVQHAKHCRRAAQDGNERVIVDPCGDPLSDVDHGDMTSTISGGANEIGYAPMGRGELAIVPLCQRKEVGVGDLTMSYQGQARERAAAAAPMSSGQNSWPGTPRMRSNIDAASRGLTACGMIPGFEEIRTNPSCVIGQLTQEWPPVMPNQSCAGA